MRLFHKVSPPIEVISIPFSVEESFLGRYFFGQTEPLNFGGGYHAWGALRNPSNSDVKLFWNVYTISNFSSQAFTAEIWLNSSLAEQGKTSGNVAASNQSCSLPHPKVELKYADRLASPPSDGIFSFLRRVEPKTTLTRHDFQGLIILPPGGSATVFLPSPGQKLFQSKIAFGWWEQARDV